MTLVMKFGGTSVGSADAVARTAELVRQSAAEHGRVVVVASAMGTKPVKVTDMLLQGAHSALAGDGVAYQRTADALRQAHAQVVDTLLNDREPVQAEIERFIARYEELCSAVLVLGELTPRALDTVSAMGEQMSVRILAAALREQGQPAVAVDATELVITDDNFQSAAPIKDLTGRHTTGRLLPLLAAGVIPVVTGFIGSTKAGQTTTLGRGGSDYSAAILGRALQADEVWIWTDVDGVMTADPRLVPEAQTIAMLTAREVAELAYYGAKVLHPRTIRPCIEAAIPLRIKNTFNPSHPGTVIVPGDAAAASGGMKAVTAIEALSLVTVEGKGMMGVPGIAARTFGAVARHQANVLLISQASSEQSICFSIPQRDTEIVIADLEKAFARELERHDIERIWAMQPVSIVTVVGAGMQGTPGIAGRLFSALGRGGTNVIAIAQGSSECSISLVVAGEDTAAAVQQIHALLTPAS